MMENLIPQLGQRLFPTSEKTGWKSSSADVPDICDQCSQPRPAQTEAARAKSTFNDLKKQINKTKLNTDSSSFILHFFHLI